MQTPRGNIVIDTTPDLRTQLLREKVDRVDALLFTHYHADHVFGLDDVRVLNHRLHGPMPVYAERSVRRVLRNAFAYAFDPRVHKLPSGGIPKLDLRLIDSRREFEVLGEPCVPIRLWHGQFRVLGFRFGDLAYCTDVNRIPERSMRKLLGLDVLILDALRDRPHPTHFSLAESLEAIDRLRPRRCFLTHIAHELDHAETQARLPA